MIRAVLDTNVLLSGFVSSAGAPARLLDAWRAGVFELVLSEHILEEFRRNLDQPYFRRRLTSKQAGADLDLLREYAEIVEVAENVVGIATHPEDDVVLSTASSGAVDCLVTGDKKLLKLGSVGQIAILSAADFVALLQATEPS